MSLPSRIGGFKGACKARLGREGSRSLQFVRI
jgi:hypothetical protein